MHRAKAGWSRKCSWDMASDEQGQCQGTGGAWGGPRWEHSQRGSMGSLGLDLRRLIKFMWRTFGIEGPSAAGDRSGNSVKEGKMGVAS